MARNERVLAKLARDAVNEATLSDSAVQHPTPAVRSSRSACRLAQLRNPFVVHCS
jgi:hypothetical protein